MNRMLLQQLSVTRIDEAKSLLSASQWSGAYYLAGYSLECALKSCILVRTNWTEIVFKDKKFVGECWTHNIEDLVKQADLKTERERDTTVNINLGQNWIIAKDWNELSRYKTFTKFEAEKLILALDDKNDGVLKWVMNYW